MGKSIQERIVEALFARVSRGRGRSLLVGVLRTRWGRYAIGVAHRVLPARQPIGVLAVVLDETGRVLLLDHVSRAEHPIGLPGGWLARAERPEDGVCRELHEELGLQVTGTRYLLSAPHRQGTGRPYGLTLVFAAKVAAGALVTLSGEVLRVMWMSPDEALTQLRDFEAEAVRLVVTRDA